MTDYVVKDSGKREEFESGMVRDTATGKTDYLLVRDGPMYERWAEHLRKGAEKYAKRNWMQANGAAELERFRESAVRHMEAWLRGETDEDHAAAVFFNINGAEYVLGCSVETNPYFTNVGGDPFGKLGAKPGSAGLRLVYCPELRYHAKCTGPDSAGVCCSRDKNSHSHAIRGDSSNA